jgi:hypothetical protein
VDVRLRVSLARCGRRGGRARAVSLPPPSFTRGRRRRAPAAERRAQVGCGKHVVSRRLKGSGGKKEFALAWVRGGRALDLRRFALLHNAEQIGSLRVRASGGRISVRAEWVCIVERTAARLGRAAESEETGCKCSSARCSPAPHENVSRVCVCVCVVSVCV